MLTNMNVKMEWDDEKSILTITAITKEDTHCLRAGEGVVKVFDKRQIRNRIMASLLEVLHARTRTGWWRSNDFMDAVEYIREFEHQEGSTGWFDHFLVASLDPLGEHPSIFICYSDIQEDFTAWLDNLEIKRETEGEFWTLQPGV